MSEAWQKETLSKEAVGPGNHFLVYLYIERISAKKWKQILQISMWNREPIDKQMIWLCIFLVGDTPTMQHIDEENTKDHKKLPEYNIKGPVESLNEWKNKTMIDESHWNWLVDLDMCGGFFCVCVSEAAARYHHRDGDSQNAGRQQLHSEVWLPLHTARTSLQSCCSYHQEQRPR